MTKEDKELKTKLLEHADWHEGFGVSFGISPCGIIAGVWSPSTTIADFDCKQVAESMALSLV